MVKLKFKFIWDKLPNIELFHYIFENKELEKDAILYSCFKYPNQKDNIKKDTLNIYYTGERFLDDLNSNITIGFLPSNIKYNETENKFEVLDICEIINEQHKVEIINVNRGYRNKELSTIKFPLVSKNNKIYIQIRDQEREHIEYLISKNIINKSIFSSQTSLTLLNTNIHLYTELNNNWLNYGSNLNLDNLHTKKPKFCCFIVSNPICWQRNVFFEMLSKSKRVDSLGRLFKNVDIITPPRHNKDEYYKLISTYRFMITFENNSLAWYHTEKIYNAFQACTIPIYWGDTLIHKTYNTNSFIHVKTVENKGQQIRDFTPIIERIMYLENNPAEYLKLFKYRPVLFPDNEDNRLNSSIKYLMDL